MDISQKKCVEDMRPFELEHEVETSGGCDYAYVANGKASTSIYLEGYLEMNIGDLLPFTTK